jgi:hypothetical protein
MDKAQQHSISPNVNYEVKSSDSINYDNSSNTSSSTSFPNLMKDGVLVKYSVSEYTTKVEEEKLSSK